MEPERMPMPLLIALAGIALGLLFGLGAVLLTGYTGIDLSVVVGTTERFYVDPLIRPALNLRHLGGTVAAVMGITLLWTPWSANGWVSALPTAWC